ncbi:PPOX class F420-dependent oxidoreductase [Kitasatospora sp. NPDC059795]|uniref:PPOX class F420-dependent oxidoreductase n=1 Tax=unclassified Kitasatospora TaxID=2633591 RepID=UPI00093CDAFB|nr:PPOX class F420-dependent oxidoreductase [Kitasatospora sp. CB01950]OKJ08190.1 pyridoxamine 5-phosphate oxidase [Kitasatospora sp. CB01950]
MADTALDRLAAGSYLLITSYRKDGSAVPTPVWMVRDGDTLGVWTAADSWKVKRIRRRADVLVGPCDVRGNPTGEAVPATATVADAATAERYRKLLARKYGLLGRVLLLGSRLRRGTAGTIGLTVVLA